MDVSDARKLKALEEENAKLKKLMAEQMLGNAILKDAAAKMVRHAHRIRDKNGAGKTGRMRPDMERWTLH